MFYRVIPGAPDAIVNETKFPGAVFYVSNATGANGSDVVGAGINQDAPFKTLAYALTQATADQGDSIFILPGHAENIAAAAAIAISVGGVRIYGLGKGAKRPTFTFITSTAATITIAGNDVWIENCLFVNGIDALANMLTISGADVTLNGCEIRDNNASFACTNAIVTTAAANRLSILNHVHRANGGKAGAVSAISIVGGDGIAINPELMDGDFSTAVINNATTACTDLRIFGDGGNPAYLRNRDATKVLVTLHANSTGQVGPNLYGRISGAGASNITNAYVGAKMDFFQPIAISNTDGTVGLNTTITASANS